MQFYTVYRMDSLFIFWLRACLCVSLIQAAPVSDNFVVSVGSNVTVQAKKTATLPCWLSPEQGAEEMEVYWYFQDQVSSPVLLYKDTAVSGKSQHPSYAGRVSFGEKNVLSRGLADGDVSLRLTHVTLADAGEYTCYVNSHKHHDKASVHLIVTQIGTLPMLTAVMVEDQKVNISCESEGWLPEPKLQWLDGRRALTPKALISRRAPSGLVSVHSWILASSSSATQCSVGLSEEAALEGRIRVLPHQIQDGSGGSLAGWVLFALAAAALVAFGGFVWYKKYRGNSDASNDEGELQKLLSKDLLSSLDECKYVNVQLEERDNGFVVVRNNRLRDAQGQSFPDGDRVTCLTAVRGTPGFSSGKHFWEVSLEVNGNANVPPKKSWWIGVTNKMKITDDSSTTDGSFWFLSSSRDDPEKLQFSSNPPIYLKNSETPRKIGVFLDYDGGILAFRDTDSRRLIAFFETKFSGEVFPLFNPGKDDQAPMEIIHREEKKEEGRIVDAAPVQ